MHEYILRCVCRIFFRGVCVVCGVSVGACVKGVGGGGRGVCM